MATTGPCCQRKEEWCPIPGVPNYEASNLGNIRRAVGGQGSQAGRVLTYRPQLYIGAVPPYYLRPWRRGAKTTPVVVWARAVCAAVHGEPPVPGFLVHHKDEDNRHNCDTNLEWMSVGRHVRHHRPWRNKHGPRPD